MVNHASFFSPVTMRHRHRPMISAMSLISRSRVGNCDAAGGTRGKDWREHERGIA